VMTYRGVPPPAFTPPPPPLPTHTHTHTHTQTHTEPHQQKRTLHSISRAHAISISIAPAMCVNATPHYYTYMGQGPKSASFRPWFPKGPRALRGTRRGGGGVGGYGARVRSEERRVGK